MQDYQSHEFSSLVSKLRAQNFSPALVRSIVVAAVDDYYAPKLKAARRKRPAFWENRERSRDSTGTALPDSVAVGLERNQLLKSLLGEDASADKEEALELRTEHFGIASYEKVQALQMIVADYDQIRAQIDADYRTKPIPDAQFDQRLQILETEKRADLERLLSPTELLEYELRNSPSAQEVRAMLRWFDPTEDEFRRLFAVQKAYDDKYPERFSESPERTKARLAARANLPIEFKNALGEARYAELMADPANKR